MRPFAPTALCLLATACSLHLPAAPVLAQVSFRSINSDIYNQVNAVSADGSVVVGYQSDRSIHTPCAWNAATGELIQYFGYPDRGSGVNAAYAVNADGSVAAGIMGFDYVLRQGGSMRWTVDAPRGNPALLPPGPSGYRGYSDGGYGITADGLTIVGQSGGQAVVWSTGGVRPIVPLQSVYSGATAITPSGSMAVGSYHSGDAGPDHAFTWSEAGGLRDLPDLAPDNANSTAAAVSADGRTVVGYSQTANGGSRLTRWVGDPQSGAFRVEDLVHDVPFMQYGFGRAAVSADGSVIGGTAWLSDDPDVSGEAVIWTEQTGLINLSDLLLEYGMDLPIDPSLGTPIRLSEITGISADGRTIVGNYYPVEGGGIDWPAFGFVVTIPAPPAILGWIALAGWSTRRHRTKGPR